MLFSSITFLFLFLPIMLAVYYIAPFAVKEWTAVCIGSSDFLCMGRTGLYYI